MYNYFPVQHWEYKAVSLMYNFFCNTFSLTYDYIYANVKSAFDYRNGIFISVGKR